MHPWRLKSAYNVAWQLRPIVPWSVSARQQSVAPGVAIAKLVAAWTLKKERAGACQESCV